MPATADTVSNGSKHQYRKLQQIGQGRFGAVYLCQDPRTERLLVMKSVAAKNVDAPARLEAEPVKLRRHPNIIELVDFLTTAPSSWLW